MNWTPEASFIPAQANGLGSPPVLQSQANGLLHELAGGLAQSLAC